MSTQSATYVNTERFLLGPDNPHWLELRGPEYAAKLKEWRSAAERAVEAAASRPHPRLFATDADFARLRKDAKADPLVKPAADRIIADAEVYLSAKPVERAMSGYRLLGPARKALTRLATLSMAYRLTGDARYVRRAEREIEAVAAFSDWNPGHFLDVAEMSVGVAVAYDWLYDALKPEVRALAAHALRDKALGATAPHPPWTRLRNNWVQVGSAGIVAAAAALADLEKDLCAIHLADVIESLPEAEGVVAPDGGFPEGPSYWKFGFTFNVFALDMMKSAFGTDFGLSELPGFRETGSFPSLMTGPSGQFFAFSDGHPARPQISALWWFAVRFGDPSFVDDHEKRLFARMCALRTAGAEDENDVPRDFPIGLLWVDARCLWRFCAMRQRTRTAYTLRQKAVRLPTTTDMQTKERLSSTCWANAGPTTSVLKTIRQLSVPSARVLFGLPSRTPAGGRYFASAHRVTTR